MEKQILTTGELIEILKKYPPDSIPFIMSAGNGHANALFEEEMDLEDNLPYCGNRDFYDINPLNAEADCDNFVYPMKFLLLGYTY